MTSVRASLAAILCGGALAVGATAGVARAGGFYLLERGTRSLGRGGAQVAGADDPGALWYNPAGLGFAGEQLLVDATMSFLHIDFARIDGGGNFQPSVHGSGVPVPVPTIAGTFDLGLEHFVFSAGIFAPNAALLQYPEEILVDGMPYPAPQRYSLLSMDGSAMGTIGLGVAWTPLPRELSIGLGVHAIVGSFAARTALSACDGVICTYPEDPDYDAIAQITLAPILTATAVLGVSWSAGPVRFGASVATPFSLSGSASIEVRPAPAAVFDGATVRTRHDGVGCDGVPDEEVAADSAHPCRDTFADVNLDFPWILRLGAELLAIENLRLEIACVLETWSVQRDVTVRPREVWIVDALGGALDYEVGALSIPRRMRDTVSVRLGGEYTIDGRFQIRLGGYFESGAFDDAYLSPLTIDSDKIVIAAGASAEIGGGVWADLMAGYAHLFSRQVRNSEVPQPNPIRPAVMDSDPAMRTFGDPVYVGNGDYTFALPFFGIGVRWAPDAAAQPPVRVEPEAEGAVATESVPAEPEPAEGTEPVPVDPSRPWYQQGSGASPSSTPSGSSPAIQGARDTADTSAPQTESVRPHRGRRPERRPR